MKSLVQFGVWLGLIVGLSLGTEVEEDTFSALQLGIGTAISTTILFAAIMHHQGDDPSSNKVLNPNSTPLNPTSLRQSEVYPPNWSNKRIKNLETQNTCLDAPRPGGVLKGKACSLLGDSLYWTQQVAEGYELPGFSQITTKKNGYGKFCIQAGIRKGYGKARDGDKVVVAPCQRDEPTQIWLHKDTWNINGTTAVQYQDVANFKCLSYNIETDEGELWSCGGINRKPTIAFLWTVWP